jgi:hypothetical protein
VEVAGVLDQEVRDVGTCIVKRVDRHLPRSRRISKYGSLWELWMPRAVLLRHEATGRWAQRFNGRFFYTFCGPINFNFFWLIRNSADEIVSDNFIIFELCFEPLQ